MAGKSLQLVKGDVNLVALGELQNRTCEEIWKEYARIKKFCECGNACKKRENGSHH